MDTSPIPGGYYIGANGRAHDASGNDLGEPLADDFPGRAALAENGILTDLQVAEVDDFEAIDGIGRVTAEKIRAELGLEPDEDEEEEPPSEDEDSEPDDDEDEGSELDDDSEPEDDGDEE